MENKNAELIRKMMTLMENTESKIISKEMEDVHETSTENELEENAIVKSIVGDLKTLQGAERAAAMAKLGAEFEGPLKNLLKDAEAASLLKQSNIRTAEELVTAVAKGLNSKLKGKLDIAILRNSSSPRLVNAAAENLTQSKQFLAEYKNEINAGQPVFERALMDSKKYTKDAITKIVEKVNSKYGMKVTDDMVKGIKVKEPIKTTTKTATGGADDAASAAKSTDDAAKIKQGKDILKTGGGKKYYEWLKKMFEKFGKDSKTVVQNGVKKVSVSKRLLQWALVAGGAYLLYSFFTDSDGNDVVVTDEGGKVIDPKLTDGMTDCLRNLIDKGMGRLTQSSSGGPVVVVEKTGNVDYDSVGGLMFFMNGRVISGDGATKRGNWKCKGGKVQKVDETSMINEQSETEMTNDVETMIDLLDFPVSGDDLSQARTLLSKYANSSKGKEFLELYRTSGLGSGSLKKSLDYIATFQAGSVLSKNKMYELIKQIESGKSGGGENQGGNETADLSGIEITWDGEKKKEEGGGGDGDKPIPVPQPTKYRDCDGPPFTFGCRSPKIKEIQRCLGMESKYQTGNFGPLTLRELTRQYGTDIIDEKYYNVILNSCKGKPTPIPTTGDTTTSGSTITPPKPSEPTKTTEPTNVEPAKVASATKPTQLNREGCKALFKTIDERDQQSGKRTANDAEIQQLRFCLQQYNFGIGTGVNKIKRGYSLTASGGDKGIRK